MIPIVHHPAYRAETPAGHRFPMAKFARLPEILCAQGLAPNGFVRPEPVARGDLVRAHDAAYVDAILNLDAPRAVERRIGLPLNATVVARSRHACGGTAETIRQALKHGAACNTAGGSHHARRSGGSGFCVFNDVGVALGRLRREGLTGRVLVLDVDVHQGDGTADIFADDPNVLTVSIHAERNFPTRKCAGDMDVGLPDGMDDRAYLSALSHVLDHLDGAGPFACMIYNAGVDPHRADKLGRLGLSDVGLFARDQMAAAWAKARAVPFAGVIGGGYDNDIDALATRHATLFRACSHVFP